MRKRPSMRRKPRLARTALSRARVRSRYRSTRLSGTQSADENMMISPELADSQDHNTGKLHFHVRRCCWASTFERSFVVSRVLPISGPQQMPSYMSLI